jgi:hypothetical protein
MSHLNASNLTDIAYAIRQLRRFGDTARALDALERVAERLRHADEDEADEAEEVDPEQRWTLPPAEAARALRIFEGRPDGAA